MRLRQGPQAPSALPGRLALLVRQAPQVLLVRRVLLARRVPQARQALLVRQGLAPPPHLCPLWVPPGRWHLVRRFPIDLWNPLGRSRQWGRSAPLGRPGLLGLSAPLGQLDPSHRRGRALLFRPLCPPA